MVSAESLRERFNCVDGQLIWKNGRRKNKIAGWRCPKSGYLLVNFKLGDNYVRMLARRIIFLMQNGYLPDLIDHIDQNPLNNKPENLRAADKSVNALNTKPRKNNRTGVKGVFKDSRGKFQSSIYKDGCKKYLGSYDNLSEAELAIRAELSSDV